LDTVYVILHGLRGAQLARHLRAPLIDLLARFSMLWDKKSNCASSQ